ncbi:hypothetical protein IEQ34_000933 [Dendrobium chrysotoxum]|uniref:WAT1-related protein n=1 Tax=Dendrobium chrysotoxum TaxID=161865 RepID=A0AAV7HML0_DENCH|nr:hypothetical protein IEQ34_000933 [Dendrobium chrysotoxum]
MEIFGPMLVVGSCVAWAIWFIMQAKMSMSFPAPYMISTIMCDMASMECFLIGSVVERDLHSWALGFNIHLASVLYIGLICSGFAVSLMIWVIEKRSPLFVSMFSPLQFIIMVILDWAILDEKLYVKNVLGSVIIVVVLYLYIIFQIVKELLPYFIIRIRNATFNLIVSINQVALFPRTSILSVKFVETDRERSTAEYQTPTLLGSVVALQTQVLRHS